MILRTFTLCLSDTAPFCRSDLHYHAMHRAAQQKLARQHCPADGAVFTLPDVPPTPPPRFPPDDHCAYKGAPGYRHCGLFGDPHLRTFNNEFQTCRVQGAWPLVDNDYFTVQVTNEPVGVWGGDTTATATSKVCTVAFFKHLPWIFRGSWVILR